MKSPEALPGADSVEPNAPAAQQLRDMPIETGKQPAYTKADAQAAERQVAQMIGDRIDAMQAQAVQKIGARFLPTMGVGVPLGKARIKAAVTDFAKVNPLAAASEFGVELAESVRLPLERQQEGRLDSGEQVGAEKPTEAQVAEEFVQAPGGGIDFGEITAEMSKAMRRQAGKIRLTRGVQNSNGTGYGLAHIEANHGKQIRALGFGTIEEFVAQVAGGIQQVWQVPGNSQLLVTAKNGRKDVMYIRLEIAKDGDFYRVNSAFPVRQQDYEAQRGMKKIWDGSEPTSAVTGQRPAFATAAIAAPDSESSQGSSNARGQDLSVPVANTSVQASVAAATEQEPNVPALTQRLTEAEAKDLMAWESLGTRDGVTRHILTFYESKADKDANRGRMTMATITKGDRSAIAWMVDGDDKTFGPLSLAKKRGMEVGMAKAKTDGYVLAGDDGNVAMFSRSTSFDAEVDAAIVAGMADDKQALRQQIDLGVRTPAVLKLLGVPDKPVYTNRDLIAKMHIEHGVPKAKLKNLAQLLTTPALVFESDTRLGRLLVVTDAVVDGRPVVIAVEPNANAGRLEVVYLPSAYPKDDADRQFSRWIRDGKLRYADKSRSRLLATTAGLELPGVVQRSVGFTPAKYKTEADIGQVGMSRATGNPAGISKKAATDVVDAIRARWSNAPEIVVVSGMQDLAVPQRVRDADMQQRSMGATGEPEGFWCGGKVSQLLVTAKNGRKDVMYIRLEIAKDGDFYRVNSAFPVRQQDYEAQRGMKKIWDGSEPTSAVTGQRPAFATAAIAAPDSESSQGSSIARGQNLSVPAANTPAANTSVQASVAAAAPAVSANTIFTEDAAEKARALQLQAGNDESGDFYAVNTAFPSSRSYAEKRKDLEKLWSRIPVPAADSGKSVSFAEPGNEAGSKSAMDSSQSSS